MDEHANSEARTRLLIEKRPNLHINYQHVFSESILSLKLDELDEDYVVKVTLPSSILAEDQTQSVSNKLISKYNSVVIFLHWFLNSQQFCYFR